MRTNPRTKIRITLTYREWLDILRALSLSLGEIAGQNKMRSSERAVLLGEARVARKKLIDRMADRLTPRPGDRPHPAEPR